MSVPDCTWPWAERGYDVLPQGPGQAWDLLVRLICVVIAIGFGHGKSQFGMASDSQSYSGGIRERHVCVTIYINFTKQQTSEAASHIRHASGSSVRSRDFRHKPYSIPV